MGPSGQAPAAGHGPDTLWVVAAEFAPEPGRQFRPDGMAALVEYLGAWQPTGMWHPTRYAIQLRVPSPTSAEALSRAMAYFGDAARAAGLRAPALVRAEVMTVQELERSWDVDSANEADTEMAGHRWLISAELYAATRRLIAAATPGEVAAIVHRFVTSVGGTVEPGPSRPRPGIVGLDLRIDGAEPYHAAAEAVSVAGLMLESALPKLLADARRALARLHQHQR